MVVRSRDDARFGRDHAFSKALWDVETAPMVGVLFAVLLVYVVWRLISLPLRTFRRLLAAHIPN